MFFSYRTLLSTIYKQYLALICQLLSLLKPQFVFIWAGKGPNRLNNSKKNYNQDGMGKFVYGLRNDM